MTGVTGSSGYRWDEIVDPSGGHELQLCSGGNRDMLRDATDAKPRKPWESAREPGSAVNLP